MRGALLLLCAAVLACGDSGDPDAPVAVVQRGFDGWTGRAALVPITVQAETGAAAFAAGGAWPGADGAERPTVVGDAARLPAGARLARQFLVAEPGEHVLTFRATGTGRVYVVSLHGPLPEPLGDREPGEFRAWTDAVLAERSLEDADGEELSLTVMVPGSAPAILLGVEAAADAPVELLGWSLGTAVPAGPRTFVAGGVAHRGRLVGAGDTLELLGPTGPGRWRAELAVARYPVGAAPGLLVTVTAGGEELATCRFPRDATEWDERAVDLPAADTPLRFAVTGDAGSGAVFIGEPVYRSAAPAAAPGAAPGPVVLISLDTLRADHLGCLGDSRGLTPNLDALAARGFLFTRATSPSNYTLPGHAGLLTGRSPYGMRVGEFRHLGTIRGVPDLATRMADEGRQTAAFTGGGYVNPMFGLAEGFDRFDLRDPLRPWSAEFDPTDTPRLREVLRWIDGHRALPFFLFLHTYHVHEYVPSEAAAARYVEAARREYPRRTPSPAERKALSESRDPDALAGLRQRYAATVADADRMVGRVLEHLEEVGLLERSLVVVVSDHGESFGEGGHVFHSGGLHDAVLHVPLILAGPGVPMGRSDVPVGLVDVAPTVLELAGYAGMDGQEGRSLLELFTADGDRGPVLAHDFREKTVEHALLGPRYELVRQAADRLYDRAADPELGVPLDDATLRARLGELLDERLRVLDRLRAQRGEAESSLPADLAEELKALGYAVK